ncbi:MAG: TIGR00366 family protein, partial [Allomuricauda sp.]
MALTQVIERMFRRYLPSPFTIAILLTMLTMVLAFCFTENRSEESHIVAILSYWEDGVWNNGLLVFAYQMM